MSEKLKSNPVKEEAGFSEGEDRWAYAPASSCLASKRKHDLHFDVPGKRNQKKLHKLLRASWAESTTNFLFPNKEGRSIHFREGSRAKYSPVGRDGLKPAVRSGGGRWCWRISFPERHIQNVVRSVGKNETASS